MGTPINERESTWPIEGLTLMLLRAVTYAGYVVNVHRLGGSLFGRPGASEMHAVRDGEVPHVSRVADNETRPGEDHAYKAALLLAGMIGIELDD